MRKKIFYTLTGFIGLIVLSYNACSVPANFGMKLYGTETTNAMTPVADEVMFALCGVINRCNPQVTLEQCQEGLLATPGFATPLGLSSSGYSTLSSIVQGEQTGVLVGNPSAGSACYDSINVLSCSDPTVVAAYDQASANPFSQSPNMIPEASDCDQVFAPSVPTFEQTQQTSVVNNSASVSMASFENPVLNGDFILCALFYNNTTQKVADLTDSMGNSYWSVEGPNTGTSGQLVGWSLETWYSGQNVTGGSNLSITANFTGSFSGEKDIVCNEYSGIAQTNPLDVVLMNSSYGANASTQPTTINYSTDLIFGVGVFDTIGGATGGPSFIERASLNRMVIEDNTVNNTGGNYSVTFSNNAMNWIAHFIAVKGNSSPSN